MTNGKLLLIAQYYLEHLIKAGVIPRRTEIPLERTAWCASEAAAMIGKVKAELQQRQDLREIFQDEKEIIDEITKVHRWLGFIQGVLFAKGIFTVDDLRDHSRKDSPLSCLNEK